MTGRHGIITGGTWCVDTNKTVEAWPNEDETAEYNVESRHGGGCGFNVAFDVRALDRTLPIETITVLGDDENGKWLRSLAGEARIGVKQMHVVQGQQTHTSDAYVSLKTRRRTHLHRPAVAHLLDRSHFDFELTYGKYLHLGMPGCHRNLDRGDQTGENGWSQILRDAQAAGITTNLEVASVNPETLRQIVLPCLRYLDMLVVNDLEIGALTQMSTVSEGVTCLKACELAAKAIIERTGIKLIVVHSPAGAVALPRGEPVLFQPPVAVPRSAVVGTNGAGDAFAAGLLYALHENWQLLEALKLAHATAAASLREVSATGGVESWEACLALAANWGWRHAAAW